MLICHSEDGKRQKESVGGGWPGGCGRPRQPVPSLHHSTTPLLQEHKNICGNLHQSASHPGFRCGRPGVFTINVKANPLNSTKFKWIQANSSKSSRGVSPLSTCRAGLSRDSFGGGGRSAGGTKANPPVKPGQSRSNHFFNLDHLYGQFIFACGLPRCAFRVFSRQINSNSFG